MLKISAGIFCRTLVLGLLLSSTLWAADAAAGQGPLDVIRTGTDRALELLKNCQSGSAPKLRDRRDEILAIVDEYTSFQEMAKRALGRPWKEQPVEKQQEFVRLFKQLLFNTYVDRVESYQCNNARFIYDEEKIEGEYAYVKTRVTGFKDAAAEVDYRLKLENGKWKVYDVVVEGISFVNNYRQQFNSILASESFDSLLNRLREKLIANTSI